MLLDAAYINDKKIGYISEKGIDFGGSDAEHIKVMAAQVRNHPIKKILKKGASTELSYKMIELIPENCKQLMGGSVVGESWTSETQSVALTGTLKIITGTGMTIVCPQTEFSGALRGSIGGDEPLGIEVKQELLAPITIEPTKPFLKTTTTTLSFVKAGESKTIDIEASGAFTIGAIPTGFSVEFTGTRLKITASANGTSSQRTGSIVLTLASDSSKTVTIQLTQAGA